MLVNDKFTNGGPANGDKTLWSKTTIGNNVSIGSNSTILPVNITDNERRICSNKNINVPGVYFGNPAKKNMNIKFSDISRIHLPLKNQLTRFIIEFWKRVLLLRNYLNEFEPKFKNFLNVTFYSSI